MKISARYLLAALVLVLAAACAAPTGPDTTAAGASLDGSSTNTGTASDSTANRGPNLFGSGN